MCGLSGQLSLDGSPVDRALVKRMTRRLHHRGPDDGAHYFSRAIGIGHRRLSIIDLAGGGQPMLNERRTLCLAANSEIYNYLELRRELAAEGVRFRTESDTEVLLKTLERHGTSALSRLEGMFAFALWNEESETLLLVRDPFGIKPLYYYQDASCLIFASEMKSILAYPRLNRALNLRAIDRYFGTLALPEPQSVFSGVRKVPAGHYLTAERGRVRLARYWTPALNGHDRRRESREASVEALRGELRRTVDLSLRSDVSVGILLSGGVDSSALAAFAKMNSRGVQTFSAAFREKDFDESPSSRAVSRHLKTSHHQILVTRNRAAEIALHLASSLDEPFADSSAIPTSAVCELAVRHVKTVLSGEGADELFGGYPWHQPRHRVGAGADAEHPSRTIFGHSERRRLYSARWRAEIGRATRARATIPVRPGPAARSALSRALCRDLDEYLPSDILFKSDRVSMTHSLEIRVPYLNRRFAEFVMSLPDRMKINGNIQKYLLKQSVASLLPRTVVARPKKGFSIPMDLWLWQKGAWRDLVYDTIFSARTRQRDQFDMGTLERLQREHDQLQCLHGYRLWTVFVFESWQRAFMDGSREHLSDGRRA